MATAVALGLSSLNVFANINPKKIPIKLCKIITIYTSNPQIIMFSLF